MTSIFNQRFGKHCSHHQDTLQKAHITIKNFSKNFLKNFKNENKSESCEQQTENGEMRHRERGIPNIYNLGREEQGYPIGQLQTI